MVGKLIITDEYEDIHSFVEAKLIDRLGDTGKKLHTGRSRNDQVALDMRLYTRQEVSHTDKLVKELLETILKIMEENTETIMPGFTHLQKAQPITLAHHMGAYFEMFRRDRLRLQDIFKDCTYPWEVLAKIGDFIKELGKTLSEDECEQRAEDVWVADSATVYPTAYPAGPDR